MAEKESPKKSENSSNYRLIQNNFDRIVDSIKSSVSAFARKAFSKSLISRELLKEAENASHPEDSRASSVILMILDRIKYNDKHFDTFMLIVCELPSLSDLSDHLSNELTTMTHSKTKVPKLMKGEPSESPLASNSHEMPQSMDAQTNQPLNLCQASLGSPDRSPMTPPAEDTSTSQIEDQIGFCCLCGQCTVDMYLSGSCPALGNSSPAKNFPFLDTESLDRDTIIDLEAKLNSETSKIVTQYTNLVRSTINSLKKQEIIPDDIATEVLNLKADPSAFSKPLLLEEENKLLEAESVSRIFKILTRYMSFYNHTILMHIIVTFGTEEDKQKRDEYLSSFTWFCKRSVFKVPPHVYGNDPNNPKRRKCFAVKMTRTTPQLTLEGVSPFHEKIAEIVGVKTSTLYLCRIDQGCVVLSFLVPTFVARERFPLDSSKVLLLQENGLKVLVDPSSPQLAETEKFVDFFTPLPSPTHHSAYDTGGPLDTSTEPKTFSRGSPCLSDSGAPSTPAALQSSPTNTQLISFEIELAIMRTKLLQMESQHKDQIIKYEQEKSELRQKLHKMELNEQIMMVELAKTKEENATLKRQKAEEQARQAEERIKLIRATSEAKLKELEQLYKSRLAQLEDKIEQYTKTDAIHSESGNDTEVFDTDSIHSGEESDSLSG